MERSPDQGSLRQRAPAGLRLIETMLWAPGAGVALWPLHRARLAAGASALAIAPPLAEVEALLAGVAGHAPLRLRLTVGLGGDAELTQAPLPPAKRLWRLGLAAEPVISSDPFRGIKSTERALYDATRAALPEGWDEALFLNERGEVVEGTITNLFVQRGGVLLTPPLASGALPGVLRASLLANGRAREAVLMPQDLRLGPLYLGNALRGLMAAELA